MNILSIAEFCGVTPKKATGDEYSSACPMCGGRDRFRLWPREGKSATGRFWCRQCEKKGDAVQLLMDVKGWDFKTAARHAGRELKPRGGEYVKNKQTKNTAFTPREYASPAERWQTAALSFMEKAHRALMEENIQLAYLAKRGITTADVVRFRLGYNPKDEFTTRGGWGVEENGKKLFLPQGIVIPAFSIDEKNSPYRLRIRRPDPEAKPRYYMVPGSNPQTYAIPAPGLVSGYAWVVVEAELDAIAVSRAVGGYVGVLALGSVAMKPPAEALEFIKNAGIILNALDYDEAGKKAHLWWVKTFPQTVRYPVPEGKDPGDYFKCGGDIRGWILAGLPPGCRPEYILPNDEPLTNTQSPGPLPKAKSEEAICDEYYGFLNIYSGYMSAHCDGFSSEVLIGWAEINEKDLSIEEQRLRARVFALMGKDLQKFKRAVIDYTNHIGIMAAAYKKSGATVPKEPELRQGELI